MMRPPAELPAWVRRMSPDLQSAWCAADDHMLETGEVHPGLLAAVLGDMDLFERMLKVAALSEGPEGERCRAAVEQMKKAKEAKRLSQH